MLAHGNISLESNKMEYNIADKVQNDDKNRDLVKKKKREKKVNHLL